MIFNEELFRQLIRGEYRAYADESGALCTKRFTDEQTRVIAERCANTPFYHAGMRLDFWTDAEALSMSFRCTRITSRIFLSIDVYEDDVLTYSYIEKNTFDNKTGAFTHNFEKQGRKRVTVHLPYSAELAFDRIELEGESYIEPYTDYSGYIYMIGDSITHGYDAQISSQSYASIVMRRLNMDGINQGAAGYVFCDRSLDPTLFEGKKQPDIITVAYGTNDWAGKSHEDFCRDTDAFFVRLRELFPDTPVLVITPVWRASHYIPTRAGTFGSACEYIASAAKKHAGMYVLDGDKMVPHLYSYYRDIRLHPNDAGFVSYGIGVSDAVASILKIRAKTFLI